MWAHLVPVSIEHVAVSIHVARPSPAEVLDDRQFEAGNSSRGRGQSVLMPANIQAALPDAGAPAPTRRAPLI